MKVKYFDWTDKRGVTHKIPDKTCVICKHREDIFLDPLKNNLIYSVFCGLKNDIADPRECKGFEYSEEYEGKEPEEIEVNNE